MTQYCHVTAGAIDEGPKPLPRAWHNISGLDKASPARLIELGWLPVAGELPAYNSATQKLVEQPLSVSATEVERSYSVENRSPTEIRQAISAEAERRKDAGTLVNGVQFRCDDASITRLTGLLEASRLVGENYEVTFRTSGGAMVTLTGAAQVEAVFSAVATFVAGVLSASALAQAGVVNLTAAQIAAYDVTTDPEWP